MNIASAIAFDTAERKYNDAWNAPSSTRFELPPLDVKQGPQRAISGQPRADRDARHDLGHGDEEGLGPAHLYPLCGFAGPLMGPNDTARRLDPVLPVVFAARMDHVGGRTRP